MFGLHAPPPGLRERLGYFHRAEDDKLRLLNPLAIRHHDIVLEAISLRKSAMAVSARRATSTTAMLAPYFVDDDASLGG